MTTIGSVKPFSQPPTPLLDGAAPADKACHQRPSHRRGQISRRRAEGARHADERTADGTEEQRADVGCPITVVLAHRAFDHVIEHRHAFFDEHLTAAWPLLQVTAQHDRRYAKQQHDNKRRDRRLCDADAAEQRDGKVDFRTIHGVESPSFVFCAAWESGRKKSMSLMQICAKSSGRMAASGSHSSARNSRI